MRIKVILTVLLIILTTLPISAQETNVFYISPKGKDTNIGTIDKPFATLEKAKMAIRDLKNSKGLPKNGVTVYLREGEYLLQNSFVLDARDSGTKDAPISYKAYNDEKASILGGVAAKEPTAVSDDIKARLKDEAKKNVVRYQLANYGITNVPPMEPTGQNFPTLSASSIQVYFNDVPMSLAKYPNDKEAEIGTVLDNGTADGDNAKTAIVKRGGTFRIDTSQVEKWKDLSDIWFSGYPVFDWADMFCKIEKFDLDAKTLTTNEPSPYGFKEGRGFYFVNILEELDIPGEYYIDRTDNSLYLYPTSDIKTAQVEISILSEPLIEGINISNIRFENLKFALTRANAFMVYGGKNFVVNNCEITKIGKWAVEMTNVWDSGVFNSHIYSIGAGGVGINSPWIVDKEKKYIPQDYSDLKLRKNFIYNNKIHDFAMIEKAYKPGATVESCGDVISHNEIYNTTHVAITFGGNFNVIEYNDIHDVLLMADDSGAIYTGRTWVAGKNTIRYNYIHNIPTGKSTWGNQGIYLDDHMYGTTIHSNVFENVPNGVFLHGGRNQIADSNLFINVANSVKLVDFYYKDEHTPNLIKQLDAYKKDPMYQVIFADILKAEFDEPTEAKYNVITNNVILNSGDITVDEKPMRSITIKDNLVTTDTKVVTNYKSKDFNIPKGSQVYFKIPNFKEIPFDKIGREKADNENK